MNPSRDGVRQGPPVPVDDDMLIDQVAASFVRIRGIERLEGSLMTRCWLAADIGVSGEKLDRLLKLLRFQGLVDLPDEHLIIVTDPERLRDIAERHAMASTPAPAWPKAHSVSALL